MLRILLVGTELALLEGLAQSFAALGFSATVAQSLSEARDLAAHRPPLVALISRTLAATASADTLGVPLAPGGALLLYRNIGSMVVTFSPTIQRTVMADLTLPLERKRLMALVQHVGQRAKATGRVARDDSGHEIAPA